MFSIDKKIGEGSYGRVFECKTSDNDTLAVKMITMDNNGVGSLLEVSIMMTYIHPNLNTCKYIEYDRPYLYLVQDKALYDLERYIKIRKKPSIENARDIMVQILRGMDVLHKENIIHSDIKPSNILIFNDGLVKVTDFTLSVMTPPDKNFKHRVGTLYYTAPEVLIENYWDSSIDIWSLGCTFYYILTGKQLMSNQDNDNKYKRVYECICNWKINGFNPSIDFNPIKISKSYYELPKDIKNIIRSCMKFKPSHRTTIKLLLQNEIFDNDIKNTYGIRCENSLRIRENGEKKVRKIISSKVRKEEDDDVIELAVNLFVRLGDKTIAPIILLVETCIWIAYKIITSAVAPITFQSQLHMILKTELEVCKALEYRLHAYAHLRSTTSR